MCMIMALNGMTGTHCTGWLRELDQATSSSGTDADTQCLQCCPI